MLSSASDDDTMFARGVFTDSGGKLARRASHAVSEARKPGVS
jgi:hypothetical protein